MAANASMASARKAPRRPGSKLLRIIGTQNAFAGEYVLDADQSGLSAAAENRTKSYFPAPIRVTVYCPLTLSIVNLIASPGFT